MEQKQEKHPRAPGKTTIAPGVLVTIARLTALGVPGVAAMAPTVSGVNRFLRAGYGEGVQIKVRNGGVEVNLYLILNCDTNVRSASRMVQQEVARAIEEMVGMQVHHIDVHIEDIDYCEEDD